MHFFTAARVVILAGLIHGATLVAHGYGAAALIAAMTSGLGMSKTLISFTYAVGGIVAGILLQFIGKNYDRSASNRYTAAIAVCTGLAFVLLAMSGSLPTWVPVAFWLALAWSLIRLFGEGAIVIACRSVVVRWFPKKFGTATAVETCVAALGISTVPVLTLASVQKIGWAPTCVGIGLMCIFVVAPIAWFFLVDPEEAPVESTKCSVVTDKGKYAGEGMTVREALRTRAFWAVTLGVAYIGFVFSGIAFNLAWIGQEQGISVTHAIGTFKALGASTLVCTLLSGYLVDRLSAQTLLRMMVLMEAIALFGLLHLGSSAGWMLYAILNGVTKSLYAILKCTAWPSLFGIKHLAAIGSVAVGVIMVTSAVAPWVMNLGHSMLGSYRVCMVILATVPVVCVWVLSMGWKKA